VRYGQKMDEQRTTNRESWMWSILFAITCVIATLPVSITVYQVVQHRSVLFVYDFPLPGWDRGPYLSHQLEKNWTDVDVKCRPQWMMYRTPLSLYLGTLLAPLVGQRHFCLQR
jgi:hypothetical protein